MKKIYKYELKIVDQQEIRIPFGGEILCAQMQGPVLCIWVLVDPGNSPKSRAFEIFGTGHPMEDPLPYKREYISTFQLQGGALVFHLFERTN